MLTSIGSEKKQENSKKIYFCFTDYAKAFVWIATSCGKFFKKWGYQTTLPAPEKSVCRSRSNSWNWTVLTNGLAPNRERSRSRLYIVTLLI